MEEKITLTVYTSEAVEVLEAMGVLEECWRKAGSDGRLKLVHAQEHLARTPALVNALCCAAVEEVAMT